MPPHNKRQAGDAAEQAAQAYLQDQGLKPIAQNYHCRWGEIDIIMTDGETLVFVEVRLRTRNDFGGATASVDTRKQQKLIKTTLHYVQQHRVPARKPLRIDVVAVTRDSNAQHQCNWIRNAVSA